MRVVDRVGVAHGRSSRAAALGLVGFVALVASCTSPGASPLPRSNPTGPAVNGQTAEVLLVETPTHNLPDGFTEAVAGLGEVSSAVPVVNATVWMSRSDSATGEPVDVPPAGQAMPLDIRGADLAAYAPLVSEGVRASLAGLGSGEVVLSATSARLRRLGSGATLTVGGTRLRVAGVVPDADVGFAEVFTSSTTAARVGVTTRRYLFVQAKPGTDWERVRTRVRALLGRDAKLRMVGPGRIGLLGGGDSVLPSVLQKEYFGEFTVHQPPGRDGWLRLNPAWTRTYVRTEKVPILGRVTCNVAVLPALRSALGEIVDRDLSSLVNPHDFGGCFAARLIPGRTTIDISRHAWGSAIDLNVSANPLGGASHQDPRLVEVFRRWGFTWGGEWLVPDPMHFELKAPTNVFGPAG